MASSGQTRLFSATWLGEGGPEVSNNGPSTSWVGWMIMGDAPVVFHSGGVVGLWWWMVREEFRERESCLERERHLKFDEKGKR